MADPLPTFVVGVGQAGSEVVKTLADKVERRGEDEFFDYMLIDSDTDSFSGAPNGAKRAALEAPTTWVDQDRSTYPYLTQDMEIGVKGAERQRPVGRYKLDNRDTPDFTNHYDQLWSAIEEHYLDMEYSLRQNRDSFNIFHVHSLGGGTGSGTYPLLGAMIAKIAEQLSDQHQVDIYTGGVGIAPEVNFDPDSKGLPGTPMYYPNTYASLSDLRHLLDASEGDPLAVPVYSRSFSAGGEHHDVQDKVEQVFHGNDINIDAPPYDNYWLVGVNEDKITGGAGKQWAESYREQIDNTIAEGLHALTQLDESVENWATGTRGLARTGTISHAEVRVPHDRVRNFCEMRKQRADHVERVEDEIPAEIETKQAERERLETIKSDPRHLLTIVDDSTDLEHQLRDELEQVLGAGGNLVRNHGPNDVKSVLSDIEDRREPEEVLLATDILSGMFDQPTAVPAVENNWEETVTNMWTEFNMAGRPKYGGESVTSVAGKSEGLQNFFREKINEYDDDLENLDMSVIGKAQDALPPVHSLLESQREELVRWRETLRERRDNLLAVQGEYDRVQAMLEALNERRRRARELVEGEIQDLTDDIESLESERDELKAEIAELRRNIDSERTLLTEEEKSKRLGILPLEAGALDEGDGLTLTRVENELNSLDDYVDQGLVDEDLLRDALNQKLQAARAWNDPIIRRNMAGVDAYVPDSRNEMWVLYHEANAAYPKQHIQKTYQADTERFAGESNIGYLADPYKIEFVSFAQAGPIESLELYQKLEEMEETGSLSALSGKFQDYRLSFAYPEWYDRDVKNAFQIKKQVTVEQPPELDLGRVDKPELGEGEKKNYVKTNGIDLYVWEGETWDVYAPGDTDFAGWESALEEAAVSFRDLQQATPDPDMKSRWLAGNVPWADLLDAYAENLVDQAGVEIEF